MTRLFFKNALLPDGWARDVLIDMDAAGWLISLVENAGPDSADFCGRIAVPGMPNLHSHAFQRAMAGLAERRASDNNGADDSFWTWRRLMYRFLDRLTPLDLAAIAGLAYVEMLESGFTAVAEFHYLHHQATGVPYDDPGAMGEAIGEAAAATGIGLTLLPVFYANGGFGGAAPTDGQRRFINDPESFARLLGRAAETAAALPDAVAGVAPHSLRAVTPETLTEIVALAGAGPVHIHIAEQTGEVDDCLAWSGARPVEWLFGNAAVDRRWCLLHATHMNDAERRTLAASGAVAGVCPVTEANLGDGIFDGVRYLADGGCLGVGSDSNVMIGLAEELRGLEYSQRLRDRGRNRLALAHRSSGRALYEMALSGGARASGRRIGALASGCRADILSLDADHPALAARQGDDWLDGWLFAAAGSGVVDDVWVGGVRVVSEGRHHRRDAVRRAYGDALAGIVDQ